MVYAIATASVAIAYLSIKKTPLLSIQHKKARMASRKQLLLSGMIAISLGVFTGCGDGGPKVVPVEGTVKLNGKPLDKILVEFLPTSDGQRSFAETDAEGHFKLTTDDGKKNGATVGKHKITLKDTSVLGDKFMGRKAEDMDLAQGRKSRIAGRFQDPEKSKLSVEVSDSGKNNFDLEASAK